MKETAHRHSVTMTDRSSISLSGVEEVLCYDEKNIVMRTLLGQLTLDGEGLNIVQLSLNEGIVSVDGRIDALYYMEERGKKGILSRIFG